MIREDPLGVHVLNNRCQILLEGGVFHKGCCIDGGTSWLVFDMVCCTCVEEAFTESVQVIYMPFRDV